MEKYLTLSAFEEQEKGAVYVLNNTKPPEQGIVCFTVSKLNGAGVDDVIVPSTFIPIDLNEQVSRRQLRDSSEFKRAIKNRILILLTQEYGQELLKDEDAQKEMERLYNLSRANMNQVQSLDSIKTGSMLNPELANAANPNALNNVVEQDVTPKIAAIMEKVEEEGDIAGAIASLRMMKDTLTQKDLAYIISRCGSQHKELSKWAKKRVK